MTTLARFGRKRRKSGGATTTFSPLDLAPDVWLDAQSITPQANGSVLATWNDLSGNANHAVQPIPGVQPTYRTTQISSKPAVRTDGVMQFMSFTNGLDIGPCTIFMVAAYNGDTLTVYRPFITLPKLYVLASGPAVANWGAFIGARVNGGVELLTGGAYRLSLVVRAPNDVDCVTSGSVVNVTTGTSYNAKTDNTIGGAPSDAFFCAADYGEIIVVSRAVTTQEREATEQYFASRW